MKPTLNESKLYDVAKNITVLLVVIAHCTRMYTPDGVFTPLRQSEALAAFTRCVYQFHMALFVFLSGAVYALCIDSGKYTDPGRFLRGKAKRLLIPYLFFGFAYVAPVMCWLGLAGKGYLDYCFSGLLLSLDARHLWFLPVLFWIYLLCVPLRKSLLTSDKNRLLILLLSGALFYCKKFMPTHFQLRAACEYQLYFMTGILFHFWFRQIAALWEKLKPLALLLPAALAGMFWFNPNIVTDVAYKYIGMAMILALAMFLTGRSGEAGGRAHRLLKTNSFGIYLFHPMIIYILYSLLAPLDIAPVLLSFGVAAVTLAVSVLATKLLRALRLGILMGE